MAFATVRARATGRLRDLQSILPIRDETDRGALHAEMDEAALSHYGAILEQEASAHEIPVNLLKAMCWYASGWRQFEPSGRALTTPVGTSTCYGCMQLNDVWHPDAFPAAQTDAHASIAYAARLMRWLYDQTGDWERACTAFFGHDRRAESAERRVRKYMASRPWIARQEQAQARNERRLAAAER
jgi:hypothetical protein